MSDQREQEAERRLTSQERDNLNFLDTIQNLKLKLISPRQTEHATTTGTADATLIQSPATTTNLPLQHEYSFSQTTFPQLASATADHSEPDQHLRKGPTLRHQRILSCDRMY